jgi:putative toxin-antitoxin system antitoxin component (TIGR02293 family)
LLAEASGKFANLCGIIARGVMMTVQQLAQIDEQQVRAVRAGLPYSSFATLKDALELSTDELAQLLGIPRRTLTKRQRDGDFSPSESNAISRVARVYREAVTFFGDETEARTWLKTYLPALGSTPLSLLDTDPGAEAVSVLLRQLAWGIYP